MQIGQEKTGMTTMNQSLKRLVDSGLITPEVALSYSSAPEEMATMLSQSGRSEAGGIKKGI